MEGILIDQNNIHAVDFIDTNSQAKKPQKNPAPIANAAEEPTEEFPTTFLTSGKDIFSIMNFVSGIHECSNYGQVKSLNLTVDKKNRPAEKKILQFMQTIAEGIQLCDVVKFENGLRDLSDALSKLKKAPRDIKNTGYLTLFQELIRDSYGTKLLDNKHRSTIDEIKWCLEKGFIQQALTLLESKMPTKMIQHKFLVSKAHDNQKQLFTKSGNEIAPNTRNYLLKRKIPKNNVSPLENVIVEQTGYMRHWEI